MTMQEYRSVFSKLLPWLLAAAFFYALWLAMTQPGLFADSRHLLLMLGLMGVLLPFTFEYKNIFPLLVVTFLLAGMSLPLRSAMQGMRWMLLGEAALLGVLLWSRRKHHLYFGTLHLFALFTVLVAFTTAVVSVNPKMTSLKALSLGLLFLYASVGARLAWFGQPERLIRAWSRLAEVLVYFSAICYFLFRFSVWGNLNSFGAVMGVICWPVLLWRYLIGQKRPGWRARGFVLLLCGAALYSSFSRASFLAAGLSSTVLLLAAKRYRLLVKGLAFVALVLLTTYILWPSRFESESTRWLYKTGSREEGILQSRLTPWERSKASLEQHPWLGIGFGVSEDSASWEGSTTAPTRERGNSYLALLEGMGALGAVPLVTLLIILFQQVRRVFAWVRSTGSLSHCSVPVATLLFGGLCHAMFEDWLLAVGYYASLIFWVFAISLPDLMADAPRPVVEFIASSRPQPMALPLLR